MRRPEQDEERVHDASSAASLCEAWRYRQSRKAVTDLLLLAWPSYTQPILNRVTMRQRAASLWQATAAAILLSGCTLSAALRHDEIRSVWGPGGALPPQ